MDFEKFDVVEVNGRNFIVLNIINYNNNTYLYLINEDDNNDDCTIVRLNKNNNTYIFEKVNEEELKIVMEKLLVEYKDIAIN